MKDTEDIVGLDYEFDPDRITVTGIADGNVRQAAPGYMPLEKICGRIPSVVAMHNGIGADLRVLKRLGYDALWADRMFDTMLAAHVLRPHLAGTGLYDLRSCILLHRRYQGATWPDLDWKDYEGNIYKTCVMDAAGTRWLAVQQRPALMAYKLWPTYQTSHVAAHIFADMRDRGVRLDLDTLAKIRNSRQEKEAEEITRLGVNAWRSPKVLDKFAEVSGIDLRRKLGPRARGTRALWKRYANSPHVSAEARQFAQTMVSLSEGANDAHWLGKEQEADNFFGSVSAFSDKVDMTGYIHPSYNVCGSPDRPIARGPNIQNFPRPADDPRETKLRSAVVGYPGHVLLSADYSAIESYTTAIEADDWDRVTAIGAGDWHARTGETFGVSRQQGKVINHAFDKGESPYALASRLYGSPTQANIARCEQIYQHQLTAFPKTAAFRQQLWERTIENPLVVVNHFGRRMSCFSRSKYGDTEWYTGKHQAQKLYWCPCKSCAPRRERFKYALAFLGRSSACDVLLRAMIRIVGGKAIEEYSLPLAEIHDSLLFSVPPGRVETYTRTVGDYMQKPVEELGGFSFPCAVKTGSNWAEVS